MPRPVGERYVLLGLGLGRLVDGLVDGFFGPEELRDEAERGDAPDASALRSEAAALLEEVRDGDLDPQRRRWLEAQVEALECVAELAAGATVPWVQVVRRCYGLDVGLASEEEFEQAHARLDAALPGRGDLSSRLERWNESQQVPPAAILDAFMALTAELRARTRLLVDLPAGEEIDAELVSGKPWGAYNWYLGQRRSRIELNTDLPVRAHGLVHVAAHEGYAGHHTEHACKEAHLVDGLGRVESSILLIHTPETVVSEGIAEVALRQVLGESWPAEAARILRPLGVPFDAAVAAVLVDVQHVLGRVDVNAAYLFHERGWDVEELVGYHRRWALTDEGRARKRVAFATDPLWSAYTPTYSSGEPLVLAYLERQPRGLERLLTEQLTPGDLRSRARE